MTSSSMVQMSFASVDDCVHGYVDLSGKVRVASHVQNVGKTVSIYRAG